GFRGQAEQLLPASAAVQLVGLLHRMAGLMTENGHALGPSAALDVEHHFLLELHQAGMGEIEWDGDARRAVRTEPLARYPRVGPQPDTPLFELFVETADAILEPGAFDRNPQTAEVALEQLLIRQRLPSVFPARHRASEHEGDLASGWCHGTLVATTAQSRGAGKGWTVLFSRLPGDIRKWRGRGRSTSVQQCLPYLPYTRGRRQSH